MTRSLKCHALPADLALPATMASPPSPASCTAHQLAPLVVSCSGMGGETSDSGTTHSFRREQPAPAASLQRGPSPTRWDVRRSEKLGAEQRQQHPLWTAIDGDRGWDRASLALWSHGRRSSSSADTGGCPLCVSLVPARAPSATSRLALGALAGALAGLGGDALRVVGPPGPLRTVHTPT